MKFIPYWLTIGLALLQACIGVDVQSDFIAPVDNSRIEIIGLPSNGSQLAVNDTIRLTANFFGSDGTSQTASIDWTSSDESVAIVDGGGLVTALAPGQTTITAIANASTRASFLLGVVEEADVISTISISKSSDKPAILVGESLTLNAEVLNQNDEPITDAVLTWMSTDTSVLKVDSEGVVTAQAIGQATISAMSAGVLSNNLLISVLEDSTQIAEIQILATGNKINVGQTLQLTAQALNGQGQVIDNLTFNWQSSNNAILSIDANGLATGLADGTVQVSAEVDGFVSPDFNVEVVDPSIARSLSISAPAASLVEGETLQFSASALNGNGEPITPSNIAWQSSNNALLSIDANGLATALGEGTVQVSASVDGVTSNTVVIAISAASPVPASRMGNFTGLNGYNTLGTATLVTESDGSLTLNFSEDFRVSNGPGLYIYLSNNARNVTGGVELRALISTNGEQSYSVPADVTIDQFNFVVVYCRPFGAPFGAAELQ